AATMYRLVSDKLICVLSCSSHAHSSFPLASSFLLFFFNAPATTEIYTLSLHDALPICDHQDVAARRVRCNTGHKPVRVELGRKRSEEHTSELQSRGQLVCRLLLEKKKKQREVQQPDSTHKTPTDKKKRHPPSDRSQHII